MRKVKPLVRVAERETAAYALLRGIDYIVEECPMVEGNTQHRYKEAITLHRGGSPGTKQQMYFGFLKRAADRFADDAGASEIVACDRCGAPTVRLGRGGEAICSFCKTKALALSQGRGLRAETPAAEGRSTDAGPFQVGERVLLIDHRERRYLITLAYGRGVPFAPRDRSARRR